uniref:RRM domain-containing protein n=1 Tax=Compsopogon caeruleus TaxID=31354 RepID=A0A7S1TFQ6_9RHOD|mmetsp:Transcript_5146/g.10474  ORF Transcript_5146/g.10474 Transcript_5146/m.10474 type:complete len:201 (+) Transcript_5146:66-668(+)
MTDKDEKEEVTVEEETLVETAEEKKGEKRERDETELSAEEQELRRLKQKMGELEEMTKLAALQQQGEEQVGVGTSGGFGEDADDRSVCVRNVDYSATLQEVYAHFAGCGKVERVTIPRHRHNQHPKGFAYVEFADSDAMQNACLLNDSFFKERKIKVEPKRHNVPGMSKTERGGMRGRGGRGRGTTHFRGYRPYPRGYYY